MKAKYRAGGSFADWGAILEAIEALGVARVLGDIWVEGATGTARRRIAWHRT